MGKIGHLTFHASHNYGSVLQAYALSHLMEKLGHEVEIINLRPTSQRRMYRIIRGSGLHRAFHYMIYPYLKKRYDHYERFIREKLPIGDREYTSTDEMRNADFHYDAYVCGGDQIWNPVCQDFETAYYLDFLPEDSAARRISYAPSLGKTEFDRETKENIKRWVRKFDFISVREKRGAELIQSMTDRQVQMVCDPVLLLSRSEWKQLAVAPKYKKPYILVYFLDNNHGSRALTEQLRRMTGYEVVIFNEYIRDFVKPYHKAYGASPEEFVGLFMNASFIYTNSFHGTAFATLFEKPFITAIAEDQERAVNNNDSRKIDYLHRIGLESRLYRSGEIDRDQLLDIDYAIARKKLADFQRNSVSYLKTALKNI